MKERRFPVSVPSITGLEREYVDDAVASGWVSSIGKYVDRFEVEFAAFCERRHGIAVSNGTVALHLVLAALGIGSGDEVVIPDLTFVATANAVLLTGATPVFCDVDPETLCLDPAAFRAAITERTRAVMPVHLYGHPADMDAIIAIAGGHGLHVIADAAEAHGARLNGRSAAAYGLCATFSFYGNKIITSGEGGMIVTDDDGFATTCRRLRDHAMSATRRYWHAEPGFNYRMTNLQAALGCAQMARITELLEARIRVISAYRRHLADVPGLRLNRSAPGSESVCWMTCVEIEGFAAEQRDALIGALGHRGVDSRPYFIPLSDMPFLSHAETPVAHAMAGRGLNLPTYFDLTDDDVELIARRFRLALDEVRG